MDPERGVGLINYSLGLYGRNELAAASNGYLKGRSWDLVEMKPASEFLKFKKVVSEMNELIVSWKSAQSALQEAGLSKKEAISLTTVRRCLKDLEQLKACGGPVTSQDEVNRLVSDANLSEVEKQNRLLTEVRYARDTSLSPCQRQVLSAA